MKTNYKLVDLKVESNKIPTTITNKLCNDQYTQIKAYNFKDKLDDNVSFVIAKKKINDRYNNESTLVTVVIRGTDGVEWQGNMDITGKEYNAENLETHKNFSIAADKLSKTIDEYCDKYCKNEKRSLLITGHSRGAAVANIYAKQMTDKIGTNEERFSNIYAYTFATPNVAKYDSICLRTTIFTISVFIRILFQPYHFLHQLMVGDIGSMVKHIW